MKYTDVLRQALVKMSGWFTPSDLVTAAYEINPDVQAVQARSSARQFLASEKAAKRVVSRVVKKASNRITQYQVTGG